MKNNNLIGISGRINSGKDTVGNIIQILTAMPHLNTQGVLSFLNRDIDSPYKIKKFADKPTKVFELITGINYHKLDRNKKEKIRPGYIQFINNHCKEMFGEDIWVDALFVDYIPIIQSTKEEDKRLLSIWKNMNTRCKNPNYEKYHKYGGKGVTICKEWEDFQKFRFWALSNGYTNELTLDRINVNGNYEPSNCRFVTSSLQAFNKGSYHQGTSNLKGVNKYLDGRWQAQIQSKGIKKNLGYYQTEEEARKVYQKEYDRINKELEEESFNLQRKYVYPNFIITDTRFENEFEAVKQRNGITIRVNRDSEDICECGHKRSEHNLRHPFQKKLFSEHESETALDNAKFSYTIENNGTLEDLIRAVKQILIIEKVI